MIRLWFFCPLASPLFMIHGQVFFSLRSLCSLSPIVFFLFAMRAPDGRGRRAWTRKPWQQYAHKQTHMCLLDPLSIPLPFLSLHPQLTLLPLCHGCQRSVPLCFWWITLLRVLGAMEGKGRGGGGGAEEVFLSTISMSHAECMRAVCPCPLPPNFVLGPFWTQRTG